MTLQVYNKKVDGSLSYLTNLHEYFTDRICHTDRFLHIIHKKIPNILSDYLTVFQQTLKQLISSNLLPTSSLNIKLEYASNSFLAQNEELVKILEKAMFTFMKFRTYEGSFKDASAVTLKFKDHYRGVFLVEYYMGQTLCSLIPRPEAFELIKEYTRGYYHSSIFNPKPEESLAEHARSSINGSASTHQALYYCDSGRLLFNVERCLYAEVIEDMPDNEIKYYFECYGDYFNHTQKNENFVLTRTHTIMKGDSCCDFCYHDKRFIEEIFHPSENEWNKVKAQVKKNASENL